MILRRLFYGLIVKPVLLLLLGLNVRNRGRLPQHGPAVIVANHNSHLDAMALMALYDGPTLSLIQPVAAADYFCRNRLMRWFALEVLGIIPLQRKPEHQHGHPLAPILDALDQKRILILFPEGSRGQPETLSQFKSGIAHIASQRPQVPIIPVFFHGLGRSLPKGEWVLVPFFIDAFVGQALYFQNDKTQFMELLNQAFTTLQNEFEHTR